MIITHLNRVDLLRQLPKGLKAAEIGVYNGGFAAQIVRQSAPEKLYAIDPWGDKSDPYVRDYGIKDDMGKRFEAVTALFSEEVAKGQVNIVRDYSYNFVPTLPDSHLDWTYIDGMHSYEAVKEDLHLVDRKVRPDGMIWGHDFSNTFMSRAKKFGIIRAVTEFVAERDYEIVLITNESAPTYVLAKRLEAEFTAEFIERVKNADPRFIDIDKGMIERFSQEQFVTKEGKKQFYFRFSV